MTTKDYFKPFLASASLHYGIDVVSEDEWKALSWQVRKFEVDQIMYQTQKDNDFTQWVMRLQFREKTVYAMFDTQYACIVRLLPPEHFEVSYDD